MEALRVIVWFVVLLVSIMLIFRFVGMHIMCLYFPEGKRWWLFPVQLLTLAFFAFVVMRHPFV